MKNLTQKNLLEFCFLLAVLILGVVYLWYTLPKLDDSMRLAIVIISMVLIIILGAFLKKTIESENIEKNN
jgi:hypothetical protein